MGMETNGRGSLPWKRSEGFLPRVRLYSLSLSLLRYQNKRERSRRKKKGIVGTSIFTRSLLSIQSFRRLDLSLYREEIVRADDDDA